VPRGVPKNGVRKPPTKKPPAPAEPVAPKNAIPPTRKRAATEQQRWTALDNRIKANQVKAKARRRTPLDLRIEEFEQVVELCTLHDEELATVLRACFRYGLRHFTQFGSLGSADSPFAGGDWDPRRPSDMDPSGLRRPGPAVAPPFRQPIPFDPSARPSPFRTIAGPPQPSTVIETYDEPIFAAPPRPDPRFLPSAPVPGSEPVVDDAPAADAPGGPWEPGELDEAI
jgi:hypothetical protein